MKTSWFLLDIGEVEQFRQFDALPIGCVVLKNGVIVSANSFFAEEVGLSKIQLVDKKISEFLIERDPTSQSQVSFDKLMSCQLGSKKNVSLVLKCSDGTSKKVAVNINAFENENEKNKKSKASRNAQVNCLLTITALEGLSSSGSDIDKDNTFSTLETVIGNSSNGIIAFDKNLRIKFFNENANHIYLENSKKDLQVDAYLSEYLEKDLFEERKAEIFREVFAGKSVTKDFVLRSGELYIQATFKPIKNSSNEVVGLLETIKDRTKEVMLRQEMLNRQLLLGSMLKMADSYFVYFDLDYKLVYFNSEAETVHRWVLNVDLKEGMDLSEVYTKDELDERKRKYYDVVLEQGELTRRIEYKNAQRELRIVDVTYKVMRDERGEPKGILEFGKDITDLVQSDVTRKSTEQTLELVMDNSSDCYVAYDLDFKVMFCNREAKNKYKTLYGADLEIGKNASELVGHMAGYDKRVALYTKVMETGEPAIRAMSYTVDGVEYHFEASLSCLKDEDGNIKGLLSCARNNSDLVKSQRALADRNSTLLAVLESSKDGIAAFDSELNVLATNKQAVEEFKKFANVDLESTLSIQEQLSPEEYTRWKESIFDKVLKGKELENIVRREETKEVFRNIYTPVKNSEGEIIGTLEISRDITEVEKSEERYRNLVDSIPTGIAKFDKYGKVSYVSPRGADFFGYSQDELLGKDVLNLMAEADRGRMMDEMRQLLSEKNVEKYSKHAYLHKNGSEIILEGIASVNTTNDDEFAYLLAFNNVTDRYEAEAKLSETASNFVSLFMNMHDAVMIYNHAEEKYVNCNDSGLKLFKREKSELLKGSRLDYVAEYSSLIPDVNLHDRMAANRVITARGEKVENSTTVLIDGEGNEKLVSVNIVPRSDDEVYLIMKDITEANETKHLLQEKTSVYEALIQNSFDGIDIVKYDATDDYFVNGELLMRNERMARLIGGSMDILYDSDDALMAISPEIQPNGHKSIDLAKDTILETIKNGTSLVEYRFEHQLGSFDVRASQKMVPIDNYVYLIKNYRDITDAIKQRAIIEDQLEALNSKNEEMKIYIESNLQLENFAYIASHDLKAPIRSVISFAQLLKNNSYDQLGPKNGRFLDIIITASTNMQVLIDDLLAYSRINTQGIEFENVDVKKLIKHLLIEINQSIAEKNGEVVIKNLPETLVGDASRLRQIFQNLITNGMKFHHEGKTPKVEIDYEETPKHYEFSVRDYGIGIEEQYLREIFLMFKKLHSENKYKGTGIGLSICKKIVDQHNGNIWVESKLGEGSTFYFTICKHIETNI